MGECRPRHSILSCCFILGSATTLPPAILLPSPSSCCDDGAWGPRAFLRRWRRRSDKINVDHYRSSAQTLRRVKDEGSHSKRVIYVYAAIVLDGRHLHLFSLLLCRLYFDTTRYCVAACALARSTLIPFHVDHHTLATRYRCCSRDASSFVLWTVHPWKYCCVLFHPWKYCCCSFLFLLLFLFCCC